MAYHNKQSIKIINKLTGEVWELEYVNKEEAEAAYVQVKAMLDALEKAKKKLLEYIGQQVEDRFDFGDGFTGMWIPKNTKRYDPAVVRKYLDEDQLSEVMDINSTKLKALFKQLVEDGKGIAGAWTDIESSAEVRPGKPYFVIKKGP